MDRRTFLAVSAVSASIGATKLDAATPKKVAAITAPGGIDRDRARSLMEKFGFSVLVLEQPVNIYYFTGIRSGMHRLGYENQSFAIVPRDKAAPIRFITPQFPYYFMAADVDLAPGVEPMLVTGPKGNKTADAFLLANPEGETQTAREQNRRRETLAAAPYFQSTEDAFKAAVKGMKIADGLVGYDTIYAHNLVEKCLPGARKSDGGDMAKHIRLIKTDREIGLMKAASQANVAAALKTASEMRNLGTLRNIRNHFNSQVSLLGNVPGFLVINGAIDEDYDAHIVEGTTVLIDGVSSRAGYHGDYGRTVFIGEPSAKMIGKVKTIGAAWDEVRNELKPGMRFSDIRAQGQVILRKLGSSIQVPFNPHCVGLAHTEHPEFDRDGSPLDIMLQPGMIISVDCPLMESGSSGTAHLEDLMLITETGSEAIHDIGNQIIIA